MGNDETISAEFPFDSHFVEVEGSKLHYMDEGEGEPVLFLHGNPTSSYLWRNIVPQVSPHARCIALDLIGMGRSDKPDIEYRFFDHVRYVEGAIAALGLENLTLVVHDWGSALGFNYARLHEGNVRGIAFMEAILMSVPTWDAFPPDARSIFEAFRTPEVGWDLIAKKNAFVERVLPGSIVRDLTDAEMDAYRAPYPDEESRRPLWRWPNEIPIEGEPPDVVEAVEAYNEWLQSTDLPMLLFHGQPGALVAPPVVGWVEANINNVESVDIGAAVHFIQEDNPHAIGRGLVDWLAADLSRTLAAEPPVSPQRPRLIIAALAAAALPFSVLQAAVVPALPTLQREFDTTTVWTAWTVTGFLVVAAVTTPLLSRLGDQHGKAKLILVSLAIFVVGAIGATFAWNIGSLIGFRSIQGSSAAVFPLAFAVVKEQLPARRVGFAMGLVVSIGGVGGGIGLLLAGVVLDYLSWRWLFGIAAIIAVISAFAVYQVIRDAPGQAAARLDLPGAVLLMAGLATLMIGLTKGPDLGWTAPGTLGLFAAGALLLTAWTLVERRVPDPLVDVRMLVRRTVLMTNLATLVAGFAMFATFVIVPVLVEAPRGLADDVVALVDYGFDGSSTLTGLLILPASLSIVVGGVFLGLLIRIVPPERLFGLALLVMTAGMAAIAAWHAAEWQLALAMVPFGLGIGVVLALGPLLITGAVRESETGVAMGMNATVRVIGSVIGGQIAAATLSSVTIGATDVPSGDAFTSVFWMSAAAALLAAVAGLLVVPRRRALPRLH